MINHLELEGKKKETEKKATQKKIETHIQNTTADHSNEEKDEDKDDDEEEKEEVREKKLFRGSFTRFQVHRSLSVKVHDRCELYTHIYKYRYTLTHSIVSTFAGE